MRKLRALLFRLGGLLGRGRADQDFRRNSKRTLRCIWMG